MNRKNNATKRNDKRLVRFVNKYQKQTPIFVLSKDVNLL